MTMEHIIDCAQIHSKQELHRILAEILHFPAYYGNNLDALYDCLTDISENTHLILQNWDHAAPFARGFKFVFDDAETENPHLFITIQ
jgi:RNAse (barnase) inhibitor barstar